MFYTLTMSALIFLATTLTAFGQEKNQELSLENSLIGVLFLVIVVLFVLAAVFMKYKLMMRDKEIEREIELQKIKNEENNG